MEAKLLMARRRAASIPSPPVMQRLVCLWLALLAIASMVYWVEPLWAGALMCGASISLLPSICFAWYSLRWRGARFTTLALRGFYLGSATKFFLTVVLFAAVFSGLRELPPAGVFLGFLIAQFTGLAVTARSVRPLV